MLGNNTVHAITLVDWKDRIAQLVEQSLFLEALTVTYAFYMDKAVAAYGLPEVCLLIMMLDEDI